MYRFKDAETQLAQLKDRLSAVPEPAKLAARIQQAHADLDVGWRLDKIRLRNATDSKHRHLIIRKLPIVPI